MTWNDQQEQDPGGSEQALEKLARSSLDDSVAHLDAATLSRLNRARQQALAEGRKPFLQRNWLPLAASGCAVVALAIALPLVQPGDAPVTPDIEGAYTSAQEDAGLVEDLDLVLWLMDEEDHAS